MRGTVYTATLGTRPDTRGTKTSNASRSRANLKMVIAMVASTRRFSAARSAADTNYFITGTATHLIFCAGDFVAAGTARNTVSTQWCLIDMANKSMSWAARPATTGADFGAGYTDCFARDRATQLMVGARAMAALLSLRQADITNACSINRASPKGMLNTTPTLTTRTSLRARLTDEMGGMFAIAELRHRAATCATERLMNNTIDLINVKRYRQRWH